MKKKVFSGVQPTGVPTLGNYLGAFKNWIAMQHTHECLFCVVDMHAITIRRDPAALRRNTLELYAQLMACGLDPQKNILFVQSHVAQHAELAWALGCYAMQGELSRMTQYKDKSRKHADNINVGLFTYPVLMAADIALYNADEVPVGQDQKQHVELTRDILTRFNALYGDIFVIPQPVIAPSGAKIMSLLDPTRKMDKSDPNPGAYLLLSDDKDTLVRKCKKAVTDSEGSVRYDPQTKPGVSNLMTIYALASGKTLAQTEQEFTGMGYGALKPAVAEAVDAMWSPVRDQAAQYLADEAALLRLMEQGAERARVLAEATMKRVRAALGFVAI